ncbi:unnamed protein product [Linum trigynum]|uniref:Uncharacterized protein n=1 Tax=Linum trigynum TaxID=586398 RepID=A0AAV2FEX9_9ROSI
MLHERDQQATVDGEGAPRVSARNLNRGGKISHRQMFQLNTPPFPPDASHYGPGKKARLPFSQFAGGGAPFRASVERSESKHCSETESGDLSQHCRGRGRRIAVGSSPTDGGDTGKRRESDRACWRRKKATKEGRGMTNSRGVCKPIVKDCLVRLRRKEGRKSSVS